MPLRSRKLKGGRVRVTNIRTGKKRTFKSKAAYNRWRRVAEAVQHGWKPSRRKRSKR